MDVDSIIIILQIMNLSKALKIPLTHKHANLYQDIKSSDLTYISCLRLLEAEIQIMLFNPSRGNFYYVDDETIDSIKIKAPLVVTEYFNYPEAKEFIRYLMSRSYKVVPWFVRIAKQVRFNSKIIDITDKNNLLKIIHKLGYTSLGFLKKNTSDKIEIVRSILKLEEGAKDYFKEQIIEILDNIVKQEELSFAASNMLNILNKISQSYPHYINVAQHNWNLFVAIMMNCNSFNPCCLYRFSRYLIVSEKGISIKDDTHGNFYYNDINYLITCFTTLYKLQIFDTTSINMSEKMREIINKKLRIVPLTKCAVY
jgi:uncharacterized protein YsxB (DUF464 family)